ncbi:polysaccharide pyruvyl transferase family protein [Paenibacillus sp. JX-17]|uniref:Polysaccharide pyruvyl transferase family protein n=1 Tax=Paenibacillus lacisoli TaxID=3064525 RepID=A0ABT9CGP1_9BACL|nr:polysaccharide pyruvyl transferase family protein [Paenibacillus sp. JX-17]MDO7908386.1 polysaccharide pyruvyl transferase family protein [Paenibacillus sp. JX-17]
MGKILITGGQMENKGAQAMSFTVINEIRNRYPDKEIIMNCMDEDRNYNFEIIKIGKKLKVELLGGVYGSIGKLIPGASHVNVNKQKMKELLNDTDLIIDISGFALSSQFSIRHSINYLVNIMLAKKYNIPMILLSQSFGPFDYEGPYKTIIPALMKKYMTYPKAIYAREQEGLEYLSKYTTHNVKKSVDIVLQGSKEFNLEHLFKGGAYSPKEPVAVMPNSVAIVPNVKTMKYGSRETLIHMYKEMTDHLLAKGKNVYLLRHSTEDLILCQDVKKHYAQDHRVVLLEDEYDCIEIHHLLDQFDFIIASRYHSIVHAYKNGTPVLALGWATKYRELLNHFGQGEYIFDVRDLEHVQQNMIRKIDLMIDNRDVEAKIIESIAAEIQKDTIFNEVFDGLGSQQVQETEERTAALQPS